VKKEYGVLLLPRGPLPQGYDGIILAVAHRELIGLNLAPSLSDGGVIYDVKAMLPREMVDERL
jgi:UDP-N-acetyl-D-galactosamine dehydrogenase